jgi:hypothetical protein
MSRTIRGCIYSLYWPPLLLHPRHTMRARRMRILPTCCHQECKRFSLGVAPLAILTARLGPDNKLQTRTCAMASRPHLLRSLLPFLNTWRAQTAPSRRVAALRTQ